MLSASRKNIDTRTNRRPVGKENKNISKNIVSPAWKQASSVERHRLVPIKRIAMAAVNHAILRNGAIRLFMSRILKVGLPS